MKRKAWIAVPAALVLVFGGLFAACGVARKDMAEPSSMTMVEGSMGGAPRTTFRASMEYAALENDAAMDYADAEVAEARAPAAKAAGDAGAVEPVAASARKLIKDISANVETRQYEAYLKAIEAKAAALGGHVASKDASDSGYDAAWYTRSASLVLRVPADKLEEFQAALKENARVTNMNESVRDVTLEYTDVETHIKVLRTERGALLKILEAASTTEEVLQVRQQLTQTRYELDALEGQMRVLEDQIALSTVTLYIQEVERLSPEQSRGFWAGAWDMFRESVLRIGRGIRDFAQGFLGAIPYLVLIAIPVLLLVLLLLRRRKKRRNRR